MSRRELPRPRRTLGAALAVVVVAIGLGGVVAWGVMQWRGAGTADDRQDQPVAPPERVAVVDGQNVVTIDPADQQKDGIRTLRLTLAPYRDEVRAYGRVLDLQKLTELANALAQARAQLQVARAKLAASQTAYQRAQGLYRDQHNVSAAQLQAAEAAFHVDEGGVSAAESALRTLAASMQQAWGGALASAASDMTPLFARLLQGQEVLIQVTLPPGHPAAQPDGGFVRRDDGSRVDLHFVSPAPMVDPRLQGPGFLFTAPAGDGLLPGMNVIAFLVEGQQVEGAVIPSSAIVWGQGQAWAYVRTGPKTFARRPVATDLPAPSDGYIVRNQRPGTEVVVQGAQMLFSEEFRSQLRSDD